jgi:hypothetical protein
MVPIFNFFFKRRGFFPTPESIRGDLSAMSYKIGFVSLNPTGFSTISEYGLRRILSSVK